MAGIYKLVLVVIINVILTAGSFAQTPLAYVSNRESNDISIINTSTAKVTSTINVGSKPRGLAVNPSCSRLYVALQDSDEVAVINTKTNSIIATIPAGNEPFSLDIHPSGSPVYVTNWEDDVITVINAKSNRVSVPDIPAGEQQQNVSFNPSGTRAFVAHRGAEDKVAVIDASTNKIDVPAVSVGVGDSKPRDIAFHPRGNPAYVTLRDNDSISVIDTINNTQTATISVGEEPVNIAVSPDGSRAYVTNNGDDSVSVLNLDTANVITSIAVGSRPNGLAITPDGGNVFVANKDNTVSLINTESNQVTKTIKVGKEPWDVAICNILPAISQKDVKNRMQIYGRVYRKEGKEKVLLKESSTLILDCGGVIQKGESNSKGQYNLINSTGIRECKLKAEIDDVTTSWPPLDVVFSSKPRRYDLIY